MGTRKRYLASDDVNATASVEAMKILCAYCVDVVLKMSYLMVPSTMRLQTPLVAVLGRCNGLSIAFRDRCEHRQFYI